MSHDNVTVVSHPVVDRDLTILRDKHTSFPEFRSVLRRVGTILAYHALYELPLQPREIETPIETTEGSELGTEVIVVPILRAGLALVDGVTGYIPEARVGHLGMYRDEETHQPVDYYSNLPVEIEDAFVLLVDPMLATGGSADDAISFLKKQGATKIHFVSLIAAPEGIDRLAHKHPDVPIITAAIDRELNDDAFIVPGLGDAGDRFFGTT
jgi:uracil phosphoribosyltransferase